MGRVTVEDAKAYIGQVCEVEWLDHCSVEVKNFQRAKPFTMKTLGRIENIGSVEIAGHRYYYLLILQEEQECGVDGETGYQITVVMLDDVTWFQPYEVQS